MKATILAAMLAAFSSATLAAHPCATIAEVGMQAVKMREQGVKWEIVEGVLMAKTPNDWVTILMTDIAQRSYYEWAQFDRETIRSLAYQNCRYQFDKRNYR